MLSLEEPFGFNEPNVMVEPMVEVRNIVAKVSQTKAPPLSLEDFLSMVTCPRLQPLLGTPVPSHGKKNEERRSGRLDKKNKEETLGLKKETTLNTYTAMKCGMKNVSSSGDTGAIVSNGAIMSQKAKIRLDDYTTLAKEKYPDSWEGRELDGELLYEASAGIPHGRVSVGDGAVKKEDIKSAARKRNSSAPTPLTLREKE
ncbi:hypothetical protein D1007_04013 [Hordeum vulgare]|nr:hypothetical protein D1007_04013 [Hordeum vulgare]